MVDFADSAFGGASFGGGYSDPNVTGGQRTRDTYGSWGNYWGGPLDDNPYAVLVEAMHQAATAPGHGPQLTGSIMGPLGGPSGHGAQLTGGIVGNHGQPLGTTSGGYVNSPYGEFGPQYGMGYTTPDSPYGEFGPPQPGGYNMSGDIDGGSDRPWWLENTNNGMWSNPIVRNPGMPRPLPKDFPMHGTPWRLNQPPTEGPSVGGPNPWAGILGAVGPYIRKKRPLAYENAYQNVGTNEGGGWV